jgi:hypothetical protein
MLYVPCATVCIRAWVYVIAMSRLGELLALMTEPSKSEEGDRMLLLHVLRPTWHIFHPVHSRHYALV